MGRYWMEIRVVPYLSKPTYQDLKETNAEIQKELDILGKRLGQTPGIQPEMDFFFSTDPAGKIKIAQYLRLKAALYPMPDYYFREVSLQWDGDPEFITDDQNLLNKCRRVRDSEAALLDKY
jgi:hypothetical protein